MRHYISDFLFRFAEGKVRNHGMARLKRIFKQRYRRAADFRKLDQLIPTERFTRFVAAS